MGTLKRLAAMLLGGLLLAGCSQPPLPPPAGPQGSPTAMVEAIRAVAARDRSVIQVEPLRDPAASGFLAQAHAAEHAARFKEELAYINRALELSPDAPDILQFRAEAEILLRDYPAADADAKRSFALGPQLGRLCAANWQTVLGIAEAQQDAPAVDAARVKLAACTRKPLPRF